MAKKPIPLPVQPIEQSPQDDCPKCPPVGAPAWMATFSDIAILLMAFFVLILSFAEFNQPKFKMISGSLRESFGVQREIPVMEQPRGTTVLEMKFSPSPEPSITQTLTQDTTTTEQPKIRSDQDERQKRADVDNKMSESEQKRQIAELLKNALENGELLARIENDQVVLDYQPGTNAFDQTDPQTQTAPDRNQSELDQSEQDQTGPAQALGAAGTERLLAEVVQELNTMAQIAAAEQAMETELDGDSAPLGQADDPTGEPGEGKAAIASDKLRVALRRELGAGLVAVERRDGKVYVTVGAGGAFPSGRAELTAEARGIMDRIAFAAMSDASTITVTGHTDDVPLNPSSPFRDNWGLAAARSASVVRELAATGLLDPTRLTATSEGESNPIADNATPEGRELNRRIEIEISF
ncbi:OmpA family protein [Thalassovita mangrovi]|uniref:OmpA family protein n=1 Tax=Thalassovita mangrovi TaxID=2692236 RepID=A0A6L8LCJ3_9RHOB|nr:OmpA family protein [Thalassovita mangrovi]MYM53731.1 OmpA family protein [Thalassovita mangrovi]